MLVLKPITLISSIFSILDGKHILDITITTFYGGPMTAKKNAIFTL